SIQAALPADYVATLDEGVQQTLANIAIYTERAAILANSGDTAVAELPAVPLPDTWIAGAAALGQEIANTNDLTVELMQGIISFAPEQLAELTPEMWRAMEPEVTAVALPAATDLDAELLAQLQALQSAAMGSAPEPAPLPESMIAAAGAAGFPVETTADIPPEAMGQLAGFAPELLVDLTQETLLGFPGSALAALPAEYVATLDAGLQQTIGNIIFLNERFLADTAVATTGEGEEEVVEAEPVDPARLPDLLIQGAQSAGLELEFAQDVPPDFLRQIGALGPQGMQILQLLTPDHLRLLQPEAIGLLPMEFLDGLDGELRAELDALASEYGGAGQLAITEAEEAAALSAGAPPLSGLWLEPNPEGEPSIFQTAADLLNNPFVPGAAAFLNFFPDAPNVENPADWMSALSIETIQFLADNEEDFVA
ncbi:MAG: hypothetical protein GY943_31400, partial [Chloroflexi bacterium]|nr:hypothetical protein [Chloroflexota bacterium]